MKVYTVGGYVRDKIMGLEPKDCDYVVVGSTPEEMTQLGYEQVGKDFPVFLHPKTGDEYALARTERKTGVGYNGFSVDIKNVSLEDDLFRRDLTINAMALSKHGQLIDPYGGSEDIKNKILRHVSSHFKEDPVRILRIARFSARYDFDIAPETISMMKEMVENGEFDHLTGERVWKEFEKVLSEKHLSHFFNHLENIGALSKISGFSSVQEKDFFNYVGEKHPEHRFMINYLHVFSNMSQADLKKWKMPSDISKKITQFASWKKQEGFYQYLDDEARLAFIVQNKGLHQPEITDELLYSVLAYHSWKNHTTFDFETEKLILDNDIKKLKLIDYEPIVKEALAKKEAPNEAVKKVQLEALKTKSPSFKLS